MGIYRYLREQQQDPALASLWRERLLAWRQEPSTIRIERPTKLQRARSIGYKAKQGFILVRQRLLRGGHTRPQIKGGRRSKHFGTKLNLRKSYQWIAEERAQRKYDNLVVLNSYEVLRDGKYAWFEVVLIDPSHPVIKADPAYQWLSAGKHKKRVFQGKTAAGKKSRRMM